MTFNIGDVVHAKVNVAFEGIDGVVIGRDGDKFQVDFGAPVSFWPRVTRWKAAYLELVSNPLDNTPEEW